VFLNEGPIEEGRYWGSQKNITDVSPDYFCEESVAEKIVSYNANAKILIILRDPVERALSHYLMLRKYGAPKLQGTEISPNLPWIRPSLYSKWVPMWKSRFPEQIRILEFSQISHGPVKLLNSVCDHFEVDRSESNHDYGDPVFRAAGPARYPYFSWLLSKQYNKHLRANRTARVVLGGLKNLGLNQLFHKYFTLPIDQEDRAIVNEDLNQILARETGFFESFKFD